MAYASGAIAQDATLKRIADALEVQSGSSEIIAPRENSSVSTNAYAIGEQFIYDGKLYKATAAIAIGDTIIPNTNCELSDTITEQIEQAGKVKGVKGNAESNYRTGNVNLTPANIGAYSKSEVDTALNGKLGTSGASTNTTVAFTSNDLAANTTVKTNTTTNQPSTVAKLSSGETLASMFNKVSSMFASIRKLWNTVGSTALNTDLGQTITAQLASIKACNTYSTSETWTGKYWIDGKKIYRRTFTVINPSKDTFFNISGNVDVSNYDIKHYFGNVKTSEGFGFPVPFYYSEAEKFYVNKNNSNIKCQITESRTVTEINLTIKYTKTTD